MATANGRGERECVCMATMVGEVRASSWIDS